MYPNYAALLDWAEFPLVLRVIAVTTELKCDILSGVVRKKR